jgi:glutamine amidotransferase
LGVAIVDYGSGNLRSAAKAFERVARERGYKKDVAVTSDAAAVRTAERVVLPGVGAFAECRRGLDAVPGMVEALEESVRARGTPFLGICVGMQLLAERGFEHGEHQGLGWIEGDVTEIESPPSGPSLKVPHMGWNDLTVDAPRHPVLAGVATGAHAYFVHSYAVRAKRNADVLATVAYGRHLAAIVGRDNIVGTQFHPEKSQGVGLRLIGNFLEWKP